MNEKVKTSKNRNAWLDTLRGFSAIWVVLYHFNGRIPEQDNLYYQFARLGYIGVPIFFIISGFCIQLAAKRSKSMSDFFWRRFSRIYPPYLASIFVVVLSIVILKLLIGPNDLVQWPQNFQEWFATLTVTTSPASSVKTVNWVYWSLTYEIFFYLVLGLTLIYKPLNLPIIYIVTGLSFIPALYQIPGLFFLDRWCLFLLGIGLYEFLKGQSLQGKFILGLGGVGMLIHTFYPIPLDQIRADPSSLSIQIASVFTVLSIIFSFKYNSFLNANNILCYVGELSYSLYLLHVPIGCYLLIRYRQGIWLESLPLHILYDLSLLLICLGISFLFYQYIEKPAIALGKTGLNFKLNSKKI
ncbi:MAG: acyltransferase [Cyanobacteria bacterium J06592_8]